MCGYFLSPDVGQAETCELQLDKCIIGGQNHVIISDVIYCRECTHATCKETTASGWQPNCSKWLNVRLLFKRGDNFGLYGILNFDYRTRVQNIQNELQNELFNKSSWSFQWSVCNIMVIELLKLTVQYLRVYNNPSEQTTDSFFRVGEDQVIVKWRWLQRSRWIS